jgi:VanZ family protein
MLTMVNEMDTRNASHTRLFSLIILFLWAVSMCMVSYLSLAPQVEFPVSFRWSDVVYHFCAYLWLSSLPFIGFGSVQGAWISALLMIPLGIGLEFGQYFLPARVFSITDMAANSFGSLAGIACGALLRSMFIRMRE